MQASSSTTLSRFTHPRARNVLALVFALLLTLLVGVSHASAAVHAKSRSHKTARAHKRPAVSGKHSKKGSKKHKKQPTSSSSSKGSTAAPATTPAADGSTTSSTSSTSTASTTATPTPSFNATSTASTTTGSVLFDGTGITSWWLNQSAYPTRTQMVPDPDGAGNLAQQFTTYNTDVYPLTPTSNPRSQLVAPQTVLKPGNTYWESVEVYIPQNFALVTGGWLSLNAMVYGYPYAGTPPAEISIENGSFRFQRNAYGPNPWQIAWSTPVVKGQWYRFTWHFLFSSTGWVQLYVNDVQQKLKSGTSTVTTLPINLLDPTDSKGPWIADEQLYYKAGMYSVISSYFKDFRVATTQTAAEY